MKSKLSPWPYIKHNKRRMAALIISLAVFAAMLYLIVYIIDSTVLPFYDIGLEKYKSSNVLAIDYDETKDVKYEEGMTDEEYYKLFWNAVYKGFSRVKDKIKAIDHVDDVLLFKRSQLRFKTITGDMTEPVYLFENLDDINTLMKHEDLKIIRGRMPKKRGEIVVDRKIANNQGNALLNSMAEGYTVVGFIDSDKYISFGFACENENNGWLLVLTDKQVSVADDVRKAGIKVNSVQDYESTKKSFDSEVGGLDKVKIVFSMVSNIILSLCIMVVLSLHISDRHNEWCLISSIGFSKFEIYIMAIKELLFAFVLGGVLGISAGFLLSLYMDISTMKPIGVHIPCFRLEGVILAVIMIIMILGFCQLPLFVNLNKVTTIDEIED